MFLLLFFINFYYYNVLDSNVFYSSDSETETEKYFSQKRKRSSKFYKKCGVRIDIVKYTFCSLFYL